jgi:hypothetical protein
MVGSDGAGGIPDTSEFWGSGGWAISVSGRED